jgi:hypothetical protein
VYAAVTPVLASNEAKTHLSAVNILSYITPEIFMPFVLVLYSLEH